MPAVYCPFTRIKVLHPLGFIHSFLWKEIWEKEGKNLSSSETQNGLLGSNDGRDIARAQDIMVSFGSNSDACR